MKNPLLREYWAKLANKHYLKQKKELSEYMGNRSHRESFIRFIQHSTRGKKPKITRQQIMQRYSGFVKETKRLIKNAPDLLFPWDEEVPIRMLAVFTGWNRRPIQGLYNRATNRIIINPIAAWTKYSRAHTIPTLQGTLKEEILHYVQYNLKLQSPMGPLKKIAKELNIFLPRSMATKIWPDMTPDAARRRYNYLTHPAELNAKLSKLKIALHKAGMVKETGVITSATLKPLLGFDAAAGERLKKHLPIEIPPSAVDILDVLNPAKVDEIVKYFNMIVKAKTPKSTQQQRTA